MYIIVMCNFNIIKYVEKRKKESDSVIFRRFFVYSLLR
jgi:hypothetical protein